jgi:hypothetical protein
MLKGLFKEVVGVPPPDWDAVIPTIKALRMWAVMLVDLEEVIDHGLELDRRYNLTARGPGWAVVVWGHLVVWGNGGHTLRLSAPNPELTSHLNASVRLPPQ